MKNQTATFRFGEHSITFEFDNKNVMVNATEMAKPFAKNVKDFTRLEQTKLFIEHCLKREDSPFLSQEQLLISAQKSGTWMHRFLAIKFAAWLNPAFELWIYQTIDQILFSRYQKHEQSLRESAQRKTRIEELREIVLNESPKAFEELETLIAEEKKAANHRGKVNRQQIDLFMNEN